MPEWRRGAAAIEEAASSRGSGGSFSFVPQIQWREDKEEKFILILTPLEEVPTVEYHDWIPVGTAEKANGETYTKYEQFISRTDPAIGESYDDLKERLDQKPKYRTIGVAVELTPVMETVKGRARPVGFEVATDTYTRQDDDGGEEEVTRPLIGLVVQSPQNFWGWIGSFNESQAPIEETPLQVVRRGSGPETTYDFIALEERPVDLSGLIENIDGVSYLRNELEGADLSKVAANESEYAQAIATLLLDKRLDELADSDRYKELISPITEIKSKFGDKGKKKPASKTRPVRPSRRDKVESNGSSDVPSSEPSTQSDRFAKLRAKIDANAS